MINLVTRNILRMVLLVLFQIAILDNIQVGGYINPYLYVLFILLLPFETPKWLLLLSAFAIGLSVDMFSDTIGIHTAACVFMAFCRPGVLALVSSKQDYELGLKPTLQDLGFKWFFSYSLILVVAHHVPLFFLEVFSFHELTQTLLRVGLSVIFTMFLLLLSQFITYRPKK
jgi:hypothetical protein